MNDSTRTAIIAKARRWWSRNDMGNVIACYLIVAVCVLMALAAVGWTP